MGKKIPRFCHPIAHEIVTKNDLCYARSRYQPTPAGVCGAGRDAGVCGAGVGEVGIFFLKMARVF